MSIIFSDTNMEYLILSENINDHINSITNGKASVYSFYYITELDENRNTKDKVNANHVQLEYTYNGKQHIMKMTIKNTQDNEFLYDLYLSNEYFDLQKIRIDYNNFNEYFFRGSTYNWNCKFLFIYNNFRSCNH